MIFTRDDIMSRLREQPFKPFQLVTTTGQAYDITHPDLMMATRRDVMVGIPAADDPAVPDRYTRVALVHVCELRDLSTPVTPSSNGPPT